MTSALNGQSLDQIFRSARTPNGWTDRAVEEETVREIYDLMKWGPTSANSSPARFVWVRSADGKAALAGLAAEPNQPKLLKAPVTAIMAGVCSWSEWQTFPQTSVGAGFAAMESGPWKACHRAVLHPHLWTLHGQVWINSWPTRVDPNVEHFSMSTTVLAKGRSLVGPLRAILIGADVPLAPAPYPRQYDLSNNPSTMHC